MAVASIPPIPVWHEGRLGPAGFQGNCSLTSSCKNGFEVPFAPVAAKLNYQSCEIPSSRAVDKMLKYERLAECATNYR